MILILLRAILHLSILTSSNDNMYDLSVQEEN